MIRKFFGVVVIASCIFLLLFTEGFSQSSGKIRIVDVEGTSIIANDDIGSARNRAIGDAIQKAVEQVVLTLIPQNTAAEKSQAIRDGIYARSEDYIQNYKIISEKQVHTNYKVGIKLKLSVGDIEDSLRALGLLTVAVNEGIVTTAVITVKGLENYADYTKTRELLKTGINSVRNYHPQRMEHGMVRFIVNIQGRNIQSFADELVKTGQFSLDTVSTDRNYIEVNFLKQR